MKDNIIDHLQNRKPNINSIALLSLRIHFQFETTK